MSSPEPGTYEWAMETANAVDPEPDWEAGEPYADQARGVMYYDTQAGYEAGVAKYPGWTHAQPGPEPGREAEAG
jgi:hypothetical protein